MSFSCPSLSVVIPVYNERVALFPFLEKLSLILQSHWEGDYEIIVLDDASTDGTGPLLENLLIPRLKVISLPENLGSGHARRVGSLQAQGELVAWIDGDDTYEPEDLIKLAREAVKWDQTIGYRSLDFGCLSGLRLAVKKSICIVCSLLWAVKIPDLNCGLRVFKRQSLSHFIEQLPNGFSCVSTATLSALNAGQSVQFIPIHYKSRPSGSHSKFKPIRDTGKLLRVVGRLAFDRYFGGKICPDTNGA
ncbi:MAG: glycosyltransferase family 2 protein [Verrucomicrobiota bacterium]|nr:glycosyltransferase family 2 protein [Verrucomicrobiota bacterium]